MKNLRKSDYKKNNEGYLLDPMDPPLHALIHQHILNNRHEDLQHMRNYGAFNFDHKILGNILGNPNELAILHSYALPGLDALGMIFDKQSQKNDEFPLVDKTTKIQIGTTRLDVTQDMKDFVREICQDTIAAFRELSFTGELKPFEDIKTASMSIVASFACAIDDPELLKLALIQSPDLVHPSMKPGPLSIDYQQFKDQSVLVSPALYAIHFAAVRCLPILGDDVYKKPLTAGVNIDHNPNTHSAPESLGYYLDHSKNWGHPSVAKSIFRLLSDKNNRVYEEHLPWVSESLPRETLGGNYQHLADLLAIKFPHLLKHNKRSLEACAIDYANPHLLQVALPDMHFEINPPGGILKNKNHPVHKIINIQENLKISQDLSIALVLAEMERRKILDPEIQAKDKLGSNISHISARNNWTQVLMVLDKFGFDMETKDAMQKTPFEIAQSAGSNHAAELIQSIAKKRAVDDILGEIGFFDPKPADDNNDDEPKRKRPGP